MVDKLSYYRVEAGPVFWMTLRDLEALGNWDYFNDEHPGAGFDNASVYAALCTLAAHGGYCKPTNGMDVTVREVDMIALMAEISQTTYVASREHNN